MKLKKIVMIPATIILGTSLLMGGCTAAKKPLTPTKPAPTTPAPTNPKAATNETYPKHIADRVVKEANQVKGVKGSTAVISDKNIFLGLDLEANLEKSRSAEVEKTVLNRVKDMNPGYTVTTSSDIDTVTRIKKVSQGVAQGKPVSSFSKELQDIGTRLKPRMK